MSSFQHHHRGSDLTLRDANEETRSPILRSRRERLDGSQPHLGTKTILDIDVNKWLPSDSARGVTAIHREAREDGLAR